MTDLGELAGTLAATAVANATREFPYAPGTVLRGPEDLVLPRVAHPAFHGCYDWHSAVHTHWLLVHLLRRYPSALDAAAVRAVLTAHLTVEHLATETTTLRASPGFERPYGWAWLAALAAECRGWSDEAGSPAEVRDWAAALAPAADAVADLVLDWLPRAGRPVRAGTHANTAFALGLLLDAAPRLGRADLAEAVRTTTTTWFGPDRDAPLHWEPSGEDFLSPGLAEADLVRRVLPAPEFGRWLDGFWPGLAAGAPRSVLEPVTVADRTDGHLGHLDGLNLSRAAALRALAAALGADDPRGAVLRGSAAAHRARGLEALAADGYLSTHWLGTFAVLALQD
ncbi:DUF2891 family protein [Kineococcus aurantiacus]|uniref:DUF2891 domain-containing protein n=1 Tax=Kineococcus aurantiacus TaxID=37633 RepID=A0A7Y9DM97_9ACTN|nr:hypothetical protein [Kineococcus aurantiacus]